MLCNGASSVATAPGSVTRLGKSSAMPPKTTSRSSSDWHRDQSSRTTRLSDSTILQWGVVEETVRTVQASDAFTAEEKEDISKTADRWLRCAGAGRLSMTEMEFAYQGCGLKEPKTGRLSLRKDVTPEQLREFHRRVLAICDKYKISREPFEKSVSQVFHLMIEDGLAEKQAQ